MAKYTRSTLTGDNAPVNAELEKIQSAINDQFDRSPTGGVANQLDGDLDANSKRIYNLPAPSNPNDAARLKDVQEAASGSGTVLPDQTGQEGKYLKTDATTTFWGEVSKSSIGLGSVDNTTDLLKPVSTAQQTEINTRALQVDTFANLELLTSATTGQAFVCQGRANAKYILKESGYVALAGDATFANNRVAALQDTSEVEFFGDSVGGGVADDTAAFTAAALRGSFNADKDYVITSEVALLDGAKITGSGNIKINGFTAFTCSGSTTSISTTTSSKLVVTNVLDLADASALAAKDYILITSTIKADTKTADSGDFQLDGDDEGVYYAEFAQIKSIASNAVTLTAPTTIPRYPSGTAIAKVNFKTISISSNINFIRNGHLSGGVKLDYCLDSKVSLGHSTSNQFTGSDIIFERCLRCVGTDSETSLDPSITINYLGSNPSAEQYFAFNSFKTISSQDSGFERCTTNDGTQCFDITYNGAPSIRCFFMHCQINRARHNMMTTHPNAIDCYMLFNKGVKCQRGVSARGRADLIAKNNIGGVTKGTTIDTGTSPYGIVFADGFNRGSVASDNNIDTFYRAVHMNTANADGFSKNEITVTGGSIANCTEGVRISRDESNSNRDLYEDVGMSVQNVTFTNIDEHCIRTDDEFINGVIVTGNTFPTELVSGKYCFISTEENCARLLFSNNVLPASGRYVSINGITDATLGADTYIGSGTNIANNNYASSVYSSKVQFDGTNIDNPKLWPYYIATEAAALAVTAATTSIDVTNKKVIIIDNSSAGTATIVGLTGGNIGDSVTLVTKSDSTGSITYAEAGGNIGLKNGSSSVEVPTSHIIVLHCISLTATSSAWVQSE